MGSFSYISPLGKGEDAFAEGALPYLVYIRTLALSAPGVSIFWKMQSPVSMSILHGDRALGGV